MWRKKNFIYKYTPSKHIQDALRTDTGLVTPASKGIKNLNKQVE